MLYKRDELKRINRQKNKEFEIALSRYLYKFVHHRKEVKRLKMHEKDFLFFNMQLLRTDDNTLVYNLYNIPEAEDFLFNKIILTYGGDYSFSKGLGPYGPLTDQELRRDKIFFESFYNKWLNTLSEGKGKYLSEISNEVNKKRAILSKQLENGVISQVLYDAKSKYLNTIAFFIYYKIKLFFDGEPDKYLTFNIHGYEFVINIYTYTHVLFRHYIPSISFDDNKSLNSKVPFLTPDRLPIDLQNIISKYFHLNNSLTPSTEFLLLHYGCEKYIIWIKYKKLKELNQDNGFEVRTFYKCTEKRDLDKFVNIRKHVFITCLIILLFVSTYLLYL